MNTIIDYTKFADHSFSGKTIGSASRGVPALSYVRTQNTCRFTLNRELREMLGFSDENHIRSEFQLILAQLPTGDTYLGIGRHIADDANKMVGTTIDGKFFFYSSVLGSVLDGCNWELELNKTMRFEDITIDNSKAHPIATINILNPNNLAAHVSPCTDTTSEKRFEN